MKKEFGTPEPQGLEQAATGRLQDTYGMVLVDGWRLDDLVEIESDYTQLRASIRRIPLLGRLLGST